MVKLLKFTCAVLLVSGASAGTLPSFEAASVRVSAPLDFMAMRSGKAHVGAKYDAGRLDIGSMSLRDVIIAAYRIKAYQLEGPDWMRGVMVDIVATLPADSSEDQIPEMLQSLLIERFGLKMHKETKEEPIYALIVAKGGPKLKDAPPDDPNAPPVRVNPNGPDFGMMGRMANSTMSGDPMRGMVITSPQGDTMKVSMSGSGIHMEASKMDMTTLTEQLTQYLDRPVIDRTNLKGNYQIALDLTMEDMMNFMRKQSFAGGGGPPPGAGEFGSPGGFPGGVPGSGGGSDGGGSSVMASIQRLGLKLDPQKAPGQLLVIDQLEKAPTEN